MPPVKQSMTTTAPELQPDAARGVVLQGAIDSQLDRFPWNVFAAVEVADDLAARGHFHPPCAGNPAQDRVEELLEAVLADFEIRAR